LDENEADMEVDDEDDDEMPIMEENNVQDPRAGNVSVTLPQLNPDFEQLSQKLYIFGSSKNIPNKRRNMLYELTKQFKDLANDVYPLAPNVELEQESKIPKVKVSKVAERRMKEEHEHQEQIKKEREEFKQALKRKNHASSDLDLMAVSNTTKEPNLELSGDETEPEVDPNLLIRRPLKEKNEEILEKNEEKFDSGDETDPEVDPNLVIRKPLEEKSEEILEEKLDSGDETEEKSEENLKILENEPAEITQNQQESPQKKKKKKKKKKNQISNLPEIQDKIVPENDKIVERPPSSKKKKKKNMEKIEENITDEEVVIAKKEKKKKNSNEIVNNKSSDDQSNEKQKVEIEKTTKSDPDIQTE
jgi:hypothetical protein